MSDLDNLEYYIKFPNPNYNYNATTTSSPSLPYNGESDYVFVVNEDKLPVIILFGWAGCQDRYLAKYSQIYEDKGLITLRYTAPVKCLFLRPHQVVTIGEKLVKLLVELNFDSHPVIIHCFSNGGAFLYQNFSLALKKSQKPVDVKGVIFDSAPGQRRISSLYGALSAILGGRPLYNISLSFVITMFLSVVWLYEVVVNFILQKQLYQHDPFAALINEPNKWPQHFIYSKTDVLISYKDIELFINHRQQQCGIDVTTLRFDDSPHVKHYSHNKNTYVASVCNFINKCLNGKVGGGTNN